MTRENYPKNTRGGVLWFFSNEGHYYDAHFYAPAGTPLSPNPQDMDVVVELMGKGSRYNEELDRQLIAGGFERYGKYLEYSCALEEALISEVRKKVLVARKYWDSQGYVCQRAKKTDYPAMRQLWDAVQEKDDYAFGTMTDVELEEMERFGRGIVIFNAAGELCAQSLYLKKNHTCYSYIGTTSKLGLAGWAAYEKYLSAYEDGCTADITWVREDNRKSGSLSSHTKELTGKYFWQFVCHT